MSFAFSSFAQGSEVYKHTTTAANVSNNWTNLDNPASNGNTSAIVIVEHDFSNTFFTYADSTFGVWYSANPGWAIFCEDNLLDMRDNLEFNVLVAGNDVTAFTHIADAASNDFNVSYIDHPDLNGNPSAIFFFTNNYQPNTTYNDNVMGVWYNTTNSRWSVYNEDQSSMVENSSYNIVIPGSGVTAFKHTSDAANISNNWTTLDHPDLNSNPDALVFVEHDWTNTNTYTTNRVGVWYDGARWNIYNENISSFATNLEYNVMVYANPVSGIQSAQVDNSSLSVIPTLAEANSSIQINLLHEERGMMDLRIMNMLGQTVYTQKVEKNTEQLDMTVNLPPLVTGTYSLQIGNAQLSATQKLIIK